MRLVFSAMRRSAASAPIATASVGPGARNVRRPVRKNGSPPACRVEATTVSERVIMGSCKIHPKIERGSRQSGLPLFEAHVASPVRLDAGGPSMIHRLLGCGLRLRHDRYVDAALCFGAKLNATVDQGEQRVVPTNSDIAAGMALGAALARD